MSSHRRAVAASEENALGGVVSDEEEEGVVRDEGGGDHGAAQHHDGGGGSGGLSSLLVDFHEGLVVNLRHKQVVGRGYACRSREGPKRLAGTRKVQRASRKKTIWRRILPEKSLLDWSKASTMPMLVRTAFMSYFSSSLNRGRPTCTSIISIMSGLVQSMNFSYVSACSSLRLDNK